MRIKDKIWVNIAKDADMEFGQFTPSETKVSRQIDAYTQQFNGDFSIDQTTNEDLDLGDITAVKGLWLEVSADCLLTLNGAATPIQLRRAGTGTTDVARVYIQADITQINITAPADAGITGTYAIWGDASS